jgi:Na+-driven multidrug efflux pump
VLNTIPFGVGVATTARIGNLLGARNARGAARSAAVAAWLSMLLGAVVLVVLMATRDRFALLFNDDPRVVRLTADVLPYVALFQIAGTSSPPFPLSRALLPLALFAPTPPTHQYHTPPLSSSAS